MKTHAAVRNARLLTRSFTAPTCAAYAIAASIALAASMASAQEVVDGGAAPVESAQPSSSSPPVAASVSPVASTAPPAPASVPVAAPPPSAPPPPPPPPPTHSNLPAFLTGGAAVVAAGAGTACGISALAQAKKFKEDPTTRRANNGENMVLATDLLFGAAFTFGIASAVLFLTNDSPSSASAASKPRALRIVPAPYVTSSGGGGGALVTF